MQRSDLIQIAVIETFQVKFAVYVLAKFKSFKFYLLTFLYYIN